MLDEEEGFSEGAGAPRGLLACKGRRSSRSPPQAPGSRLRPSSSSLGVDGLATDTTAAPMVVADPLAPAFVWCQVAALFRGDRKDHLVPLRHSYPSASSEAPPAAESAAASSLIVPAVVSAIQCSLVEKQLQSGASL